MREAPFIGFFSGLQRPIRDGLRGIASIADAAEEALEPAAELLPEPVRSRFHGALVAIENVGKRLASSPVSHEDVMQASSFLAGETSEPTDRTVTATVICHAWEHLHDEGGTKGLLISETIVADSIGTPHDDANAEGRAAGILLGLLDGNAVGPMPGIRPANKEQRAEAGMSLMAIFVWLLSSRAENLEEEQELLDLAMALVVAIRNDVQSALDDQSRLTELLLGTSRHL